jgi:type I restriction enzyme, S subunit
MKVTWKTETLEELCERVTVGIATSVAEHYRPTGIPIFRNQNIRPGRLDDSDLVFISEEFAKRNEAKAIKPRDILTVRTGNVGISALVPAKYGEAQTFTTLITTTKHDRLLPEFLCQHLNSRFGEVQFRQLTGDAGRGNLNAGEFVNYAVDVPPVPEQRGIADVLQEWDRGTGTLEMLIAKKTERRRGLMQQLLTGRMRFKGFKGEWRHCHLGHVVESVSRPIVWDEQELYRLASVRRWCGGVFAREELRGDQIKVKKLQTIRAGDFLISHIQAAYGAMAMVPQEFDGAKVSELYTILRPRDPKGFDIRFLGYLGQTKRMWHMAIMASNGFFAERLRLNFDPEEFLRLPVAVPPTVAEQAKIGDSLEACDREIELLEKQLAALKEQKRGLMQKLLTGEIRVKAETRKRKSEINQA